MAIYNDVTETIGNTPLVRLNRLTKIRELLFSQNLSTSTPLIP